MNLLLLLIVFLVYLTESLFSCKRAESIIKSSKKLYLWDGLLTVLPFVILNMWTEHQGIFKLFIVLAAVAGSLLGVKFSGVLKK